MKFNGSILLLTIFTFMSTNCYAQNKPYTSGIQWEEPKVVTPGKPASDEPTPPPSDAIVLFDGKDLSKWNNGEKWVIEDGYAIAKGGGIRTKEKYGSCQFHVEFATPAEVKGKGQGRGNSGVYMMGRYEVQILDSYENKTYYDGQAGAIYKQKPPLVNACRKPGEWQSYDIIFNAPKFNEDKSLAQPGSMTVLHNGVLIQNHHILTGGTDYWQAPKYKFHQPRDSIMIQFHGNPVRFRNIWLREIPDNQKVEKKEEKSNQK